MRFNSAWTSAALAQFQTAPPPPNFNFLGGGARANGMGGAFLGVSDDASAATWNPAGLTQQDRLYAAFDYSLSGQEVTNSLDSPAPLAGLFSNTSSQGIAHFSFLAFNGPATIKGQRFYFAATWVRSGHNNFEDEATITDFSDFPPDPTPRSHN